MILNRVREWPSRVDTSYGSQLYPKWSIALRNSSNFSGRLSSSSSSWGREVYIDLLNLAVVKGAIRAATAIDAGNLGDEAKTALLAATRDDRGLDHDLAALVRSAATPGLADRIRAFVATQVKK